MKKTMKSILCLCLVLLTFTLIFTACDSGNDTKPNAPETDPPTHTHTYGEWIISTEATCTSDGLRMHICECGEKETAVIPAAHNYKNGVCSKCSRGLIDITLPKTPITVHKYDSDGSIIYSFKITALSISKVEIYEAINQSSIEIVWSGEKTYDKKGDTYSRAVGFGYKIYDSEGYVLKSDTAVSTSIVVGEKFRDKKSTIQFDNNYANEVLSMEILNLG